VASFYSTELGVAIILALPIAVAVIATVYAFFFDKHETGDGE
jgi:hypothetical protein